jgi:hypothetical protein
MRNRPQNLLISNLMKVTKKSGDFHALLIPMVLEIKYFTKESFQVFNCVTKIIERYNFSLLFVLADREFRLNILNRLSWSSYFGCSECNTCGVKSDGVHFPYQGKILSNY